MTQDSNDAPTPTPEIDPRVVFAAERTLLAWIRTGLSLMGFGFVVARFGLFLREMVAAQQRVLPPPPTSPAPGFSLWIGIALVALGIAVNLVAVRQHYRFLARLNRGETMYPATASPGAAIAAVLALLGVVIAVYLFLVGTGEFQPWLSVHAVKLPTNERQRHAARHHQ